MFILTSNQVSIGSENLPKGNSLPQLRVSRSRTINALASEVENTRRRPSRNRHLARTGCLPKPSTIPVAERTQVHHAARRFLYSSLRKALRGRNLTGFGKGGAFHEPDASTLNPPALRDIIAAKRAQPCHLPTGIHGSERLLRHVDASKSRSRRIRFGESAPCLQPSRLGPAIWADRLGDHSRGIWPAGTR
jgi:hypothetical protein